MSQKQVLSWCKSEDSVTSEVAQNPTQSVGEISEKLYTKSKLNSALAKVGIRKHPSVHNPTKEDLDWAAQCGKFDKRPSDLFLKLLANVFAALEKDPLAGVVSPPLLASTGTIPLSVISVIPDHFRHYANCIIRTEHEACIATNYLEKSNTAKLVANALRELSKRHEGKGKKVIVKFMYDRGAKEQMVQNHVIVGPENWPDVDLPTKDEIPNVDMQIVNFHRPVVGTFHTKMAVFDRKIALLSSCNMQDRVNVEMTIHLEGAIVDGFYDAFLLSWHLKLEPPLPLLTRSAVDAGHHGRFGKNHEHLADIDIAAARSSSRSALKQQHDEINQGGTGQQAATAHAKESHSGTGQAPEDRTAAGDTQVANDADNQAEMTSQVQSMNLKDAGPGGLAKHLNVAGKQTDATTQDGVEDFNPIVLHAQHAPFPIAMVNRRPHGRPGHGDISNPQDAAWLSGFRFAERKIFIQTPTFNAEDVVSACTDACKRGIDVTLWLDLGFNDAGEMIPMQGGTNEDNVKQMYADLKKEGKADRLHVFWYVGKDQAVPLNASEKARNCHVKFASFDDTVAVVGNGLVCVCSVCYEVSAYRSIPADHSQEINVMIDSPEVIQEWHNALNTNQNTMKHGKVDDDGIWRYPDGRPLESLRKKPGGPIEGLTTGVGGAIKRAKGDGGF